MQTRTPTCAAPKPENLYVSGVCGCRNKWTCGKLCDTDHLFLCRYIELSNGLRALLISDFSGTDGNGDSENREDKGDTEDREEEEEEEREEEGDSGEGSEEDEEEDEEEEQDSDFDELEDENTGKKKRGSSEKQVGEFKWLPPQCPQTSWICRI